MILLLPSISLVGRTLPSSFIQRASTSSYHHYPRVFSSIITPTTTTATSFKLFELSGKINDDDGGGGPIGRDTKITVNRSDEAAIATATATIRTMIKRDRIIQQLGLVIGIVLILTAIGVGCGARLIDPTLVGICSAILTIIGMLYTESHNEYRVAMSDSCFVVRDSTIANAGKGLFATTKIKEGTYLMEYEGEIYSNEDQYFDRYPNGDGKYVAEIQRSLFQAPFYIDCVDLSKSNLVSADVDVLFELCAMCSCHGLYTTTVEAM